MRTNGQKQQGFSTIEILIAFSVGIIFLTSAMMIAFTDPTLAKQYSLDSGQSITLDTILDSNALATSSNKIANVVAAFMADWNSEALAESDDIFEHDPEVLDISPCMKQITNTTNWDSLNSRSREITFGTTLSSMDIAQALGPGGCDPFAPSGWETPESFGSSNVTSIDGGTDVAVRTIDGVAYAFVTATAPGTPTKEDVAVIDVSDGENPEVSGTPFDTGMGLNGIAIAGSYAYVIQDDVTNEIQILDISDPETLDATDIVAQISLPNITCTFHNQNCQRKPRSIFYYDDYLYIGTGYMAGNSPELHVYCINNAAISGCTPTTPIHMDSLNVNHNVNDIFVKDNNVYLATSASYGELTIIDATDKNDLELPDDYLNPSVNIRKYNALTSTGGTSDEDGTSVYVVGKYAYLGRERAGNNRFDFYVLDVSNVESISKVGNIRLGIANNTYVSGIIVQGRLAFLSTTDSNEPLLIFDITDKENPTSHGCSFNFSQETRSMTYADNLLFTVNRSNDLLRIVFDDTENACTP
jgi:hypothetical protein